MVRREVTIQTKMDMETRPVAHLVQEASQYESQIFIETEDKKINAKSIMGMMSLDFSVGTRLEIVAEGKDEEQAVEGVAAFLTSGK